MTKRGIRDLVDSHGCRPSHLQQFLIDKEVPGRWEGKSGLQNTYNLIDGKVMPKDGGVFFALEDYFDDATYASLSELVLRYSKKGHPLIPNENTWKDKVDESHKEQTGVFKEIDEEPKKSW